MISVSNVELRVGKRCPGFVRFWIYFVKISLRALEIPLVEMVSISSKSILVILTNMSHWSLIVNFKFNCILKQPTKTKSNASNKNYTLSAFKEYTKHRNRFTDDQERGRDKTCTDRRNPVSKFSDQKSGKWARFSLSWHFFVSKWILLRVGELTSLVEFFWFLFLVFQCYRTVAYLL